MMENQPKLKSKDIYTYDIGYYRYGFFKKIKLFFDSYRDPKKVLSYVWEVADDIISLDVFKGPYKIESYVL